MQSTTTEILTLVATAAAALAAWYIGYRSNSIAMTERSTAAHDIIRHDLIDLTTGETENARNIIGTFRYGNIEAVERYSAPDIIRAYYRLSWALERSAIAVEIIEESGWLQYAERAVNFQWRWHLEEISRNISIISSVQLFGINDRDAREHREEITRQLRISPNPITPQEIEEATNRFHSLGKK